MVLYLLRLWLSSMDICYSKSEGCWDSVDNFFLNALLCVASGQCLSLLPQSSIYINEISAMFANVHVIFTLYKSILKPMLQYSIFCATYNQPNHYYLMSRKSVTTSYGLHSSVLYIYVWVGSHKPAVRKDIHDTRIQFDSGSGHLLPQQPARPTEHHTSETSRGTA